MKAIVYTKYGPPDVLRLTEVEKPAPGDDDVLIKVHAASVNALDWHLLTADIFLVRLMGEGLLRPRKSIPGADVAGRVEAVGKNVTQFQPGDDVFGGVSHPTRGSFAEYVCSRQSYLALKPANVTFDQAAAVPVAASTALQGLRDAGRIRAGQRVLIQGAAGGVGTYAVQIAKALGAEVTAVCSSRNMEQARALGADHIIDYTREDFTRSGQQYDLIFAANGYHSLWAYRRSLTATGIYVMAGGTMAQIFQAMLLGPLLSKAGGRTMGNVSAQIKSDDMPILKEMLEAGTIVPLVEKRYPLAEAADALRYLGTGHARAKLVITVA